MSTNTAVNRATTGPFEMEGLEWVQYGHFGMVRSLATASAVVAKLKELGYEPTHGEDLNGLFYSFTFAGDFEPFGVVRIILIAVDFGQRPLYEIACRINDGDRTVWRQRFGTRAYINDHLVDAGMLQRAYDEHGHDNVIVRPTLGV